MEHDTRPWGEYVVLDEGPAHKLKRITVRPGRRLSYQTHAKRSEHWFIVTGSGRAVVDGRQRSVVAGEAIDIPKTVPHRIENDGSDDLVFIEVQHGEYFGEDDIVRLEDDFGRL